MCCDMLTVMGFLQQGRVTIGFIGGAEVDRFGNLNTTQVQGPKGPVRLPGSGGGGDIASLARRLLIIMAHEKRRFVEKVNYITSPGFGDGGDWRSRQGLGPRRSLGRDHHFRGLAFRSANSTRPILSQVHPGISPETVIEQTGWNLKTASRDHHQPDPDPGRTGDYPPLRPAGFLDPSQRTNPPPA